MSKLKQFLELQQLDDQIGYRGGRWRDLERQQKDDSLLTKARAELEAQRQRLQELEKAQREAEWTADDLAAKIKLLKEKLYGGSTKNPKELLNISHELDTLTVRRNVQDEKALELMAAVEEAQKDLSRGQKHLEQLEKDWQTTQKSLGEEIAQETASVSLLEKQRYVLAASLEPDALELYERLRARKQGTAVVRVERGICLGCRITLTMNEMQRARLGQDLVLCSSCGRIMCAD